MYAIPSKIIDTLIKYFYINAQCSIKIKNITLNALFGDVLYLVIRQAEVAKSGIGWTDEKVLEDLNFDDEICLHRPV